jgi:hypothetical protein
MIFVLWSKRTQYGIHDGSVADRFVFFSDIFWCDRQTFFNVLWQSRAKTMDKTVTKDGNRQFFWPIDQTKNPEPTSDPLAQAILIGLKARSDRGGSVKEALKGKPCDYFWILGGSRKAIAKNRTPRAKVSIKM